MQLFAVVRFKFRIINKFELITQSTMLPAFEFTRFFLGVNFDYIFVLIKPIFLRLSYCICFRNLLMLMKLRGLCSQ